MLKPCCLAQKSRQRCNPNDLIFGFVTTSANGSQKNSQNFESVSQFVGFGGQVRFGLGCQDLSFAPFVAECPLPAELQTLLDRLDSVEASSACCSMTSSPSRVPLLKRTTEKRVPCISNLFTGGPSESFPQGIPGLSGTLKTLVPLFCWLPQQGVKPKTGLQLGFCPGRAHQLGARRAIGRLWATGWSLLARGTRLQLWL